MDYLRPKVGAILKAIALLVLVYLFLVSIGLIGASFKFFGKDIAHRLIETTSNPFVGLFIGILATSLWQSSSTTTSVVVGLVGGGALTLPNAIPIVMGANIGTTVTNIIVALGHITRGEEFKRAFAGATVHDFFNIIVVIILFPFQYFTNFLGWGAGMLGDAFKIAGGLTYTNPLKLIVGPPIALIMGFCQKGGVLITHLFQLGEGLREKIPGILMIIIALILLFLALRYLVLILKSLVLKRAEVFFDRYIFRSAFRGLMFGLVLTALVQSSSITTSLAVPLLGAGILTLEQVFPYTLGANVGTTVTAILASFATNNIAAVSVAFAHLLFNLIGIGIIWPVRLVRQLPLVLSRSLAQISIKSRLIPIMFIILTFYVIPFILIFLMG